MRKNKDDDWEQKEQDQRKKRLPWTQRENLNFALNKQSTITPTRVFGRPNPKPNMQEIFYKASIAADDDDDENKEVYVSR